MDVLFLKLGDTIQGEVTFGGYAGQIEILSFSHGIAQPILHDLMGRAGGIGKPQHQDFTVMKYLDLSSVPIIAACDRATVIPDVVLTLARVESDNVVPFWIVTMKDVIVASIAFGGGGGGRPVETLTLNYTAITWLYQGQVEASGEPVTETTAWNLRTNTEIV